MTDPANDRGAIIDPPILDEAMTEPPPPPLIEPA